MYSKINFVSFFLLFTSFLSPKLTFAQANSISKENFRTELIFLKGQLENNHPNLYLYRTPKELDSMIDSISESLDKRIDMLQAYHHVSNIASYIQDGHALIYPSDRVLKQFYNEGPILPFEFFYDGEVMNLISDYSNENLIPIGSEIKSIDGVSIQELYDFMVSRLPRDGNNMQYPSHIFYKFLPAYYAFFFGFKDSVDIEYMDADKEIQKINIQALPRNIIRERKKEKGHIPKAGITFKIDEKNNLAILSISSFDKNLLKDDFQQNFKKEVRAAFKTAKEKKLDNLVIDLRDNQGGDLSNGYFLLNQISRKKIKVIHSLEQLKIDKKSKKRILKKKVDLDYFVSLLSSKSFRGKTYLFINGGSFSCSAIVANEFKKQELGIVIGEMSGGSAAYNGGSPNEVITLPYTKIIYTIPTSKYTLNKNSTILQKGVVPDIEVKDQYSRYLGGEDLYLWEVLKSSILK